MKLRIDAAIRQAGTPSATGKVYQRPEKIGDYDTGSTITVRNPGSRRAEMINDGYVNRYGYLERHYLIADCRTGQMEARFYYLEGETEVLQQRGTKQKPSRTFARWQMPEGRPIGGYAVEFHEEAGETRAENFRELCPGNRVPAARSEFNAK